MPAIDPTEYDLSGLGIDPKILPSEYGRATLSNLDALMAHRERGQLERLYDEQEERGLFRSGQTERRALEEVAYPGVEARRRSLLDVVGGALGQQREERLGETEFQRGRQMAGEEWKRRLEELQVQFQNQKALIQFQKDLGLFNQKKRGLGSMFTESLVSSAGSSLGTFAGPGR